MLNVVLDSALEHSEQEIRSARDLQSQAVQAAEQEIQRLQKQNNNLSIMLQAEKENSNKLRDNLVSQITALLTGFTTAQDQSLSTAVASIQSDNETGCSTLNGFVRDYSSGFSVSEKRGKHYSDDLDMVRAAASAQREEAVQVSL